MAVRRFSISFGWFMRALGLLLFMGPDRSWVDVADETVTVRMGWAFRARLDRRAITSVRPWGARRVLGWGAHGWRHRWLVNGSSRGIVVIDLDPMQRGHTAGFPLRLRQVCVSVDDPDGLIAVLADRSTE